MTSILRAGGTNFDVAAFVKETSLVPDSLWRKGEKRFPRSKTSDAVNITSGVRFIASKFDFSELSKQIEEATAFLLQHHETIKVLASFPGVEAAVLDFGAEVYPPGWASFTFPPELLALAGSAGVSLCLSVYPTESNPDADA